MNKLAILFIFIPLISFSQKIDRKEYYDYNDDVQFRIYSLRRPRTLDRGSGYHSKTLIAKKGKRFVSITFEFVNKSSEKQIIDFEEIYIKDQNSELHKIDFVVMSMKFTTKLNYKQKLKPNKKRKIVAEFRPAFDKDEVIKTLVINRREIDLKYK